MGVSAAVLPRQCSSTSPTPTTGACGWSTKPIWMDSPLFGLEANCYQKLEGLVNYLQIKAVHPDHLWRLEQLGLHPDWLEVLGL